MTREELYGFEFDWFAIDKNNNIAFISSAGYGNIPDVVIQHREDYDNIVGSFSTPHYGTMQIWDDYASYGLFVYDWEIYDGPYLKMKEPNEEMSEELRKKIMNIPSIPILSVDFLKSATLEGIQLLP